MDTDKNQELIKSISLANVMEDRDFFGAEGFFKNPRLRKEVVQLSYGMHLLRCEIYRLRMLEHNADEEWVSKVAPDFVEPVHVNHLGDASLVLIHYNLRQQIEYLRSEVLAMVVRLKGTGRFLIEEGMERPASTHGWEDL